jgi:hypothetical protein
MADMNRLEAYLALEREMLRLDEAGDALADSLRDAMDPLWYQLGDEEREFLNGRTIPVVAAELEPLRFRLDRIQPLGEPARYQDADPFQFDDWKCAA